MILHASEVKELAKNYGADLVGIASAQTLNAFPRTQGGHKHQTEFLGMSKALSSWHVVFP